MGSFDELLKEAKESADRIEGVIEDDENIIIIGHLDADGIASSSLIGQAIHRRNGRFIIRILGEMNRDILGNLKESDYGYHILCELGGGLVGEIDEFLDNRWLLIDHHQVPENELSKNNVFNSWKFGYDGSNMVSAAGMAYFIAVLMDKRNTDLSWLPIVAALGDRQDQSESRSLTGLNRKILDDAVELGLIHVFTDLILYGRETKPVHEALASTSTPYIPSLSGNKDACLAMIISAGIEVKNNDHWRTLFELTEDEKKKLVETIIPHLPISTRHEKIGGLIGEIYTLDKEDEYSPLRDAREFATVLNACGRTKRGGIGVGLCLGDRSQTLNEGEKVLTEYRQTISKYINEVAMNEKKIVEETYFNMVIGDEIVDEDMLGAFSSILSNMPRFAGKALIARTLTSTGDMRFSARIPSNFERSVNLGSIMREAALVCNGLGGGHDAAAGAKITPTRFQEFLKVLKEKLAFKNG
jgi:single-stranded-DNA-specific exonuclease